MKKDLKKYWKTIVGVLVAIIIFNILSGYLNNKSAKNSLSTSEILDKTVKAINEKTPITVDQYTRLDGASSTDKNFIRRYTLSFSKKDIDINDLKKKTEQSLISQTCTDKNFKYLLDNGITIESIFNDVDNNFLMDITVNSASCSS